jgi:hypothetical protein
MLVFVGVACSLPASSTAANATATSATSVLVLVRHAAAASVVVAVCTCHNIAAANAVQLLLYSLHVAVTARYSSRALDTGMLELQRLGSCHDR